ncbi:MAG TPA: hypothetical protein VK691_01815 [Solirubrobacteraceae bacterium]|jgi:DNA-binding beta-propeller fold protein YncE|nr:hypothetical protein [Solirubrobacteraceae bacterium]
MRIGKPLSAALVILGVSGGALAVGGDPALASLNHGFIGSFGGAGAEAGQFNGPVGVAVSQAGGRVYVVDRGNGRVEYFGSSGKYEGQFDGSDAPGGPLLEPTAIAVDQSDGDVWVADSGHNVVDEFSGEGVYVPGSQLSGTPTGEGGTIVPFSDPDGVAVSPAGSGLFGGDLYVSDHENHLVDIFGAGGAYVSQFSPESRPWGLAIDAEGNVYVSEAGAGSVKEYSAEGVPLRQMVRSPEEAQGVAVDPSTGDIYINNVIAESGSAIGAYETSEESKPEPVVFGSEKETEAPTGYGNGIAVNAGTHMVYAANVPGNDIFMFEEGEKPPAPTTEAATELGATSATLNGTLGAGGGEVGYYFSYEAGSGCDGLGAKTTTPGKGAAGGKVSAAVAGLALETAYTVCLVTTNRFGKSVSAPQPFTTLPAVQGLTPCTASGETTEGATLNASLEPDAFLTKYHLEYGLSSSYGTQGNVEESSAAQGVVVAAQAVLTGLEPAQTYDCRLVASREIEGVTRTAFGGNGTFKTAAEPPAIIGQESSRIGTHSVQLNAKIDPENSATTYQIEYVAAGEYCAGCANPYEHGAKTPSGEVGANVAYDAVQQTLEGLAPDTTYHYRVVASNAPEPGTGTSIGADATFTTASQGALVVTTAAASGVTLTSATLSGSVNPEGGAASYVFEIGGSEAYGTDISGLVPGSDSLPHEVALRLEGLAPDTTYYYRLSATNSNGTSYGQAVTFTTPGSTYSLTLPLTPPLLGTPAIVFPTETGIFPSTTGSTTKKLTKAQKLAKALKACHKRYGAHAGKLGKCEKQARRRYGRR